MSTYANLKLMITIFQHGVNESSGEIENYLLKTGTPFKIVRLYESNEVPDSIPSNLIILGGQMSVNDTKEYPFFIEEKRIIRKMIGMNRPILGICLGAQLIASAFGQRVYPGIKEIGWHQVARCDTESFFPESSAVFHWHNETFNLPPEAKLVLQGDLVKNQAFCLGSALAVQFHPEITQDIISNWTKDLSVQIREKIEQESILYLGEYSRQCHDLIDRFMREWV